MGVHRNDPVGENSPSPVGNECVEMLEDREDLIIFSLSVLKPGGVK